jgi:hypothetical protein
MVERYAHHSVESLKEGIEVLEVQRKEVNERGYVTIPSLLEGHHGRCKSDLTKVQTSRMVIN